MDEPEGFLHLLEIFNRYPLHELIIHPRVLKDYYDNTPNWEMFGEAVHKSRNPVCYNGDIFTVEDYRRFRQLPVHPPLSSFLPTPLFLFFQKLPEKRHPALPYLQEIRITVMDEYWGDDGEAPRWRQEKHIGKAIDGN